MGEIWALPYCCRSLNTVLKSNMALWQYCSFKFTHFLICFWNIHKICVWHSIYFINNISKLSPLFMEMGDLSCLLLPKFKYCLKGNMALWQYCSFKFTHFLIYFWNIHKFVFSIVFIFINNISKLSPLFGKWYFWIWKFLPHYFIKVLNTVLR